MERWFAFLTAVWYLLQHQLRAEVWLRLRGDALWGCRLTSQEQRRCRHYFRGAVFLGAVFAAQRGRAMQRDELQQFAYLAALAGLFDDTSETAVEAALVQVVLPSAAGATLASVLHAYAREADSGEVLVFFWEKIRSRLPSEVVGFFEETLHRVFNTETSGVWWAPMPSSAEFLAEMSAQKGGHSALLFRLLLTPPPSTTECQVALALGTLVQISDDLFDLWHDARQRLWTPARWWAEMGQLDQAARYFDQAWQHFDTALRAASAASAQRYLVGRAQVGLLAVLTRFCLAHYRRLAEKHGTLPWQNRKAMVLDMARWSVRLRAFGFALQNGFWPK